MDTRSIRRVLVRAPNWLGDAVMALPALTRLRAMFANSHIAILARDSVAGLFEGEALADEVLVADDEGVGGFLRQARILRGGNFDLAVLLQNSFRSALLARASRARAVAGYPTDGRRFLLSVVVPFPPDHKKNHQVFYYLAIASHLERMLGGAAALNRRSESEADLESVKPKLLATGAQVDRAIGILKDSGIRTGGPGSSRIVALNPGATNSRAKRWLAERFAQTADQLAARDGFQTIIIGTQGDLEIADQVASHMQSRAAVLAGRTTIGELKGVLACSSLVISNDTGAAHVAAALGVPTVVVFGPTEHFATRPLSDGAEVVRHPVDCSPCMLRDCPIDHRCMTRVEVDDVYHAARRLLTEIETKRSTVSTLEPANFQC
jgi:heptosyltransferase-2